jgi:hypothetical protein
MITRETDDEVDFIMATMRGRGLYIGYAALAEALKKSYMDVISEDEQEEAKLKGRQIYNKIRGGDSHRMHIVFQKLFDILGARVYDHDQYDRVRSECGLK